MKIQIKSRFTAEVLFECEAENMKAALKLAIEKKANLRSANLGGADLGGANLGGADLGGANLRGANLRGANLRSANLRSANLGGANLGGANLGGADLRGANLGGANLRGANLGGADLRGIKEDFFKVLAFAKQEVVFLYDALMRGKIDGELYRGECACLVGTIANARKIDPKSLPVGIQPDSSRPAERWFLAIKKGDIPQSNQVSAITQTWIEEFAKKEGIELPKFKLISSEEFPKAFATEAKKPLAVGDRVAVYRLSREVGTLESNAFQSINKSGMKFPMLGVRVGGGTVYAHPKQCRRLKTKATPVAKLTADNAAPQVRLPESTL